MEQLGISWIHVLAQLATGALILSWLTVTILALRRLRTYHFGRTTTILWAALIVLVPFVVALAFLRIQPARIRQTATHTEP